MDYQAFHTILSRLDFRIDTYASDYGLSYLRSIESDYLSLTGEEVITAEERCEILSVLDALYMSKINAMCRWTDGRDEYCDGDSFSCIIDGMHVSGTVNVHPKHLSISIESPFKAEKSCSLMLLEPVIFTEYPFVGSPTSGEGTAKLRGMIARKYFACKNSA